MRKTPTAAELDLLVSTTICALPDSISKRKTVLVTLLYLLPRGYERRLEVSEILHGLRIHEQAQARFRFDHDGEGKEQA